MLAIIGLVVLFAIISLIVSEITPQAIIFVLVIITPFSIYYLITELWGYFEICLFVAICVNVTWISIIARKYCKNYWENIAADELKKQQDQ